MAFARLGGFRGSPGIHGQKLHPRCEGVRFILQQRGVGGARGVWWSRVEDDSTRGDTSSGITSGSLNTSSSVKVPGTTLQEDEVADSPCREHPTSISGGSSLAPASTIIKYNPLPPPYPPTVEFLRELLAHRSRFPAVSSSRGLLSRPTSRRRPVRTRTSVRGLSDRRHTIKYQATRQQQRPPVKRLNLLQTR
jgi:hypothetical protein